MKNFSSLFLSSALLLSLTACGQSTDSTTQKASPTQTSSTQAVEHATAKQPTPAPSSTADSSLAKSLLTRNCLSCHNPTANPIARTAPPMAGVKQHYLMAFPERDAFIHALVGFVNHPDAEKAHLKNAINKFGLMPSIPFPQDDLQTIAAYIYDAKLQEPEWFQDHMKKMGEKRAHAMGAGMATDDLDLSSLSEVDLGMHYVMKTKLQLGGTLMKSLAEKGSAESVAMCNTKADPIQQKMADELGIEIKRVSDKNRNPENKANAEELAYIELTKSLMAQGKKPKPQLTHKGKYTIGYYPIKTKGMCLQCHGDKGSQIDEATQAKLAALYPDDLATGYKANELRGIWVVKMPRKKVQHTINPSNATKTH